MIKKSYRLVFIGGDEQAMVSVIANHLLQSGLEPKNIASMRLCHSVITLVTLDSDKSSDRLYQLSQPVVEQYRLNLSITEIPASKSQFIKSDAYIRVFGEHKESRIAEVTKTFTDAGLDIHGMESRKFDKKGKNVFVSNIKGRAKEGIDPLYMAAIQLAERDIEATISTDYQLLA